MKMICAWCGKDLGEKDGRGVEGISHCVCEGCLHKFQEEVELRIKADAGNLQDCQDTAKHLRNKRLNKR